MSKFIRNYNRKIYMLFIFFILFFSVLDISTIANRVTISTIASKATTSGNSNITEDVTLPVIPYFSARPFVQLKDGYVNITCIATDNIEIQTVEVIITYPDGSKEEDKPMNWSSDGKYVYNQIYNALGEYTFYIEVMDKAGNMVNTTSKTFWITLDKDDTDSDGMPDWWEEKYNLNPEDLTDAYMDNDGDGYTNLKEYEIGTNPAKDIFIQNAVYRMRNSIWYLAASVFLFMLIVVLSVYGKRKGST